MHSNLVILEVIKSIPKQFTYIINYNSTFDYNFDNNVEFIDVDLPCNKLNIWLLANNSVTSTKKRHIIETKDKDNEPPKIKPT